MFEVLEIARIPFSKGDSYHPLAWIDLGIRMLENKDDPESNFFRAFFLEMASFSHLRVSSRSRRLIHLTSDQDKFSKFE